MKKLVLLALALFVTVGVLAAGMFPDVPKTHWAYSYVEHLKDKGIVIGYPDGTFKGDRNITRYEEAAMISRLIGLLETEIVAPHIADVLRVLDAISLKLGATVQKVDELEKKLNALSTTSGEIASVKSQVSDLAKSLEMLKQTVNIHDKDVIKLYEAVANLQKNCEGKFAELSNADAVIVDRVVALEKAVSQLDEKIAAVQKKLLALEPVKDVLKDLTGRVTAQGERIAAAEEKIGDLSATLDNAVMTLGYVSIKLDRTQENLNKVTDRVAALEEKAKGIDANAKAIEALKQDTANRFAELESKLSGLESSFNDFTAMHDEQINYVLDEMDKMSTQIDEVREGLLALKEDTNAQFAQTTTSIENLKNELMTQISELQKANATLTGAVIGAIVIAVAAMIVGAM
ncbi:S-layer homology domain-containing protein [Thermotoga profunda]|uniref:S-layer homology domain-containing protein n=1 Tax=Thermotoga profunda TaxID=1508420 RepID=UPI0005974535|nr:S-layer homology domain-containing protein [Thermotoga profunda]